MKKTLLLLTGLLALSATAMAAEATTTDTTEFKATGSFAQNLTNYQDDHHFKKAADGSKTDIDQSYRLETLASANVTENLHFAVRSRNYFAAPGRDNAGTDENRFQAFYDFKNVAGTKLTFTNEFRVTKYNDNTELRYAPHISFADYIGASTGFAELQFKHTRHTGAYQATKALGYETEVVWDLGTDTGFSFDADLYGNLASKTYGAGHKVSSDGFDHELDLGLNYDKDLYAVDKNTIALHAELYYAYVIGKTTSDKLANNNIVTKSNNHSLSSETYIRFKHQVSPSFYVYFQPGIVQGLGLVNEDTKNGVGSDDARNDFKRYNVNSYVRVGFSATL